MRHSSIPGLLLLIIVGIAGHAGAGQGVEQSDPAIDEFWEKFRISVIKVDKTAVARLSRFPISMPYGMRSVRNRTELIRRYRDTFNHDGSSAAECFTTAKPVSDPTRPKEFTVGCKNLAGDEVIIYTFRRTPVGWRFVSLDNINE